MTRFKLFDVHLIFNDACSVLCCELYDRSIVFSIYVCVEKNVILDLINLKLVISDDDLEYFYRTFLGSREVYMLEKL